MISFPASLWEIFIEEDEEDEEEEEEEEEECFAMSKGTRTMGE